ncbi:toll/interleukin-1 receptor domain-containing protein [Mariniflexile sp. AS56]|uniref:toll/interleukin-1 receptor domain-containing protein n=1 Tax=Mariniflexile sp. AS56 TaxID=3063957 RepID=UPI0026F11515|nr:toll/interleukin-1 receptor domain-containing protein [Mariniflexile sp. AS56]MDO7173314.1 toll/interleukin-1 receptor domain-containing protein [Mariniflexile sp. AS56]
MSSKAVKIFTSYAHEDEGLKDEMDKYLKVLKRSGKIDAWNDRELIAGQEWNEGIMSEFAKANIILLLVSVDFIASDFIWDTELAEAMKRHEAGTAFVVPVILRSCKWTSMPFAKLQALPKNARPISDYDDKDVAFTEVATGIERLVDYILSK